MSLTTQYNKSYIPIVVPDKNLIGEKETMKQRESKNDVREESDTVLHEITYIYIYNFCTEFQNGSYSVSYENLKTKIIEKKENGKTKGFISRKKLSLSYSI